MPQVTVDLDDDLYRRLSELVASKPGRTPEDTLLELLIDPLIRYHFLQNKPGASGARDRGKATTDDPAQRRHYNVRLFRELTLDFYLEAHSPEEAIALAKEQPVEAALHVGTEYGTDLFAVSRPPDVFIDFSPDRREEMLHLLTEASVCSPLQPDDPENLAMFTEWFNVEWMPKVRALLQRTTITPGGDEFEAERRERLNANGKNRLDGGSGEFP